MSVIQPIVVSLAALVGIGFGVIGAYVGLRGLSTWRRQLTGNVEFDVARRVLKAVFQVQDGIEYVRTPVTLQGEVESAKKKYPEATPEKNPDEFAQHDFFARFNREMELVFQMRWEEVTKPYQDLRVALLEARALWGEDAAKVADGLTKLTNELLFAVSTHYEAKRTGVENRMGGEEAVRQSRITHRVGNPEDDVFGKQVKDVVNDIEKYFAPHLRRKV